MKKIVLALFPVITLACLFGSSKMLDPQTRVASVDGLPIFSGEIDSTLDAIRTSTPSPIYPDTIEAQRLEELKTAAADSMKAAALDSMINRRLVDVRVDSVESALDYDWEFKIQRRDNVAEALKKIIFEKQITPRIVTDSASIEQYYADHPDEFKESETVKAKHILIRRANPDTVSVKSESKKKKLVDKADSDAKKAADAIMEMALSGKDWDSLAAAFSEDKGNAARGGDLGYFTRGRMVPEFDSVAFATEPGKIVGPVGTKYGYHIIKVEDHRPEGLRPLDDELRGEIKDKITQSQGRELANAYLDSLKQAGQFAYNDEVLNTDDKFPDSTWVMSVNSQDTLFFKRYIDSVPRYMRWKQIDTMTVADKKDMLSVLASNFLLMSAGRTLGYYNDPEVVTVYNDLTTREAKLRVDNLLKDLNYEPTDQEIEDYYYAHIKDYTFERPLLVYHIIFEDSVQAAAVRDSIINGADFAEMAKRYYPGEPEIREVAYNLDYIGPEDMGRAFYAAANALNVGEISPPVKTQWGYHIIKLMSRKEDKTVKQVRPGIKHKLKSIRDESYAAEILSQWKAAATIEIDDKAYSKIEVPERKIIKIEPSDINTGS